MNYSSNQYLEKIWLTLSGQGQSSAVTVNNTSANPVPVTGTITATNPSIGANGVGAGTSSTQIGFVDSGGLQQPVSETNPLPTVNQNAARQFDSTSTTNVMYVGFALPGTALSAAAWTIFALTSSGTNPTSITWASVTGNVPSNTCVWNNRTSLTYT